MIGRVKRLLPLVLLVCLGVACGSSHGPGAEIVLRAVPQRGEVLTQAGTKLARDIIASRLDKLGVRSPEVRSPQPGEVVVDLACTALPGSTPLDVISERGQLQFFDFEKDLAPPTVDNGNPTPYPTLYSLLTAVKGEATKGTPEAYYLFRAGTSRLLHGPAATKNELLELEGGTQQAGKTTILAVPAGEEVISGPAATQSTRPVKKSPNGTYWYLLKLPPALSGSGLDKSSIQAGSDQNTGTPQVTLGFTRHGDNAFQAITKAEYERGQLVAGLHGSAGQLNPLYVQHSAIVLDGKLKVTPYIDYTDSTLSLGIPPGNGAVINNMGSISAARNFALVLQSGSLPYRFEQVSSKLCL